MAIENEYLQFECTCFLGRSQELSFVVGKIVKMWYCMGMITVTMGNSYSRIQGLNLEQMKQLRTLLSYKIGYEQAKYIPNPANRVKYCVDLKGNFATGLIDRVEHFLLKSVIDCTIYNKCGYDRPYDKYSREIRLNLSNPYPAQLEALRTILNHYRGVIAMPTGTGKSRVIAMLLASLKLRTLIVVPTLELKNQLRETLTASLNSMDGVTVENIDSTALLTATDYDCLIIDECHRSAAKTYRDLNKKQWRDIRRRYCFSATPFRNNKEEQLLYEGVCGEVIYSLSYADAVKQSYICPIEAYFYELPKSKPEGYTYPQIYSELVVNNKTRNLLIAEIINTLYNQDKYGLCLVKEVAHGKILEGMTGIPFASGADEDSRIWIKRFKDGELKVLIATEGLLGEGVDTKPCEYVILCGIGKARSALMQKIGRTVRIYPGKESGKVIFFKDKSHKFPLTHFREECKVIREEYGIEPIKLEES